MQPGAPTPWPRPAKIAFIGSHGIRKTSALLAFAAEVQRAGRSVELGREVVRDNPLGINEGATGEAQLWVLGRPWSLGIEALMQGHITPTEAALSLVLKGLLPALVLVVGFLMKMSKRWIL